MLIGGEILRQCLGIQLADVKTKTVRDVELQEEIVSGVMPLAPAGYHLLAGKRKLIVCVTDCDAMFYGWRMTVYSACMR